VVSELKDGYVELFRNANIDWLGKKWYFLSFSLLFSVAGVLSMLFWHGIPRGVDFKGGTQITFEFASTPNEDHIRAALDAAHIKEYKIQRISEVGGTTMGNKEIVSLPQSTAQDSAHDQGRSEVEGALAAGYRDSTFSVQQVDIVGPTAGKQLTHQAGWAVLWSLLGMLVYLWFRFELIYGVAAVVAVFHDTLITIGFFSLTNQEISLTVVAAILYVFGGEVLHGFSFALVIGILIGTYSSIAVAAPMLVAYQDWRAKKAPAGKRVALPAAKGGRR
jgi:preprotein translocase subunit SecF